jgi:mono/diheme cytochrome c family protein
LAKLVSVFGVLLATVFIALIAGSCSDNGNTHKTAPTTGVTTTTNGREAGAAVYAASCAGCHGSDGGGGIGPQLSGGKAVAKFPNADDQVVFVTNTHLPFLGPGRLSSEDVRAAVEYTRGL